MKHWLDHVSVQTISIPYRCSDEDRLFLDELRRVQSAAVRSAYANAVAADGTKPKEMALRNLVKARFADEGLLDSWAIQCATKLSIWKRKLVPDGTAVFGGKGELERRRKRLINPAEWKRKRLHPFVSFGDRQKVRGNQNIHLLDETTVVVKIGRKESGKRSGRTVTRTATLHLSRMTGNSGIIMRQLTEICANKAERNRINVSYSINDTHVSVTFDPTDLPDHPQRRRPVRAFEGRALGIDLNPNWIGLAVASNGGDTSKIEDTVAGARAHEARHGGRRLAGIGARNVGGGLRSGDLHGEETPLRYNRAGQGFGQIAVERKEPFPQQAFEWLGKESVRADANASRPSCRDRSA